MGSKRAINLGFSIPNGLGSLLKNTFLTHFLPLLVQKGPIFKALWDFPWAKMRHHRLKVGPLARHSGTFHGPNHVSTGSNGLKTLVRVSQMVKDKL
jgi:hypothetical protein